MVARIDISLRRNEHWPREWVYADDQGNAIDLTGWSVEMQIKSRNNNSVVVSSPEIEMIEPQAGRFTTVIDATEGSALRAFGSQLQTENLPYDIRLTDPTGIKVDLCAGVVILSRGVTLNG